MKAQNLAINEQVFHSLIFGHAKLGDLEAADNILNVMQEVGLEADHSAHVAKFSGMIQGGQSFTVIKEEMNKLIDRGTSFDDQDYFTLIVALSQKGQVEDANRLAEDVPRQPGYFNVLRNNVPKLIECGNLELGLIILNSFSGAGKKNHQNVYTRL